MVTITSIIAHETIEKNNASSSWKNVIPFGSNRQEFPEYVSMAGVRSRRNRQVHAKKNNRQRSTLAGLHPQYAAGQIRAFTEGSRQHPRIDGKSDISPDDAEALGQYFAQVR